MTTLRQHTTLWRRTRSAILAGSLALGTVLTPVGASVAMADAGVMDAGTGEQDQGFTVSDASDLSGLTAQISAGGDGLNLRAEPSSEADVVTTLEDGTVVDLRVDVLDTVYDANGVRWWPVSSNGTEGWVSGFYLVDPGTTSPDGADAATTDVAAADAPAADTGFSWDGASLSGATAQVSANGDGLNLRAQPSREGDILAQIPDGSVVHLRIDMTNTVYDTDGVTRWWPVMYNGHTGWVAGSYLTDAGTAPAPDSEETGKSDTAPAQGEQFSFDGGSLDNASAVVSASGDGLNLRSEPSASSDILATLSDGTTVELRIDARDTVYDADGVTRWWPVTVDGTDGWVSGFFLTNASDTAVSGESDGTDGSTVPSGEQFSFDGAKLSDATAIISADGDGANVRTDPSTGSDVAVTANDGATVDLRIDEVDTVVGPDGATRWWPVEVDGTKGWISGYFLTDAESTAQEGAGNERAESDVFPDGSTVMVQTETSSGARLREAAGTDSPRITSIVESAELTIVDGPVSFENSVNGWFEVETADGTTGFIDGDLLVLEATPEPTPAPETPATTPEPTEEATAEPTESPAAETTEEATTETTPPATTTPTEAPAAEPTQEPESEEQQTSTEEATETPAPTATATEPATEPAQDDGAEQEADAEEASGSDGFIRPLENGTRTQGFGCSPLGFYPYNPDWGCGVHDGIDYSAPSGTPIRAAGNGTVVEAGWCDCGLGYYVEIDHGNGVHTIYGHMASQPYVSTGQQVSQGETIGPVGSTGLSTGPHVHFMVQVNGVSQDPARYLP